MSLTRHSRFKRLPATFLRAFGDPVVFTLKPGAPEESIKTFQAVIREEGDDMNESVGGSGTLGDFAYLRMATPDGDLIRENDTLVFQGVTFKIATEGRADGRGMSAFDLTRVA